MLLYTASFSGFFCEIQHSNYHALSVHAGIWCTIIDVVFTSGAIIAQCTLTSETINFILWKQIIQTSGYDGRAWHSTWMWFEDARQYYWCVLTWHVAPFMHGCEAHSSVSDWHRSPKYPDGQVHWKPLTWSCLQSMKQNISLTLEIVNPSQ